jgi:hypothetical protein
LEKILQGGQSGRSNLPVGGHMTRAGLTGLCRWFNRPMLCELGLLFVMHFQVTFLHALVQGGVCMCRGSSCVSFWLVAVCAFGGICSL